MMGSGFMGGGGPIWWLIAAALLIIPFWKILPRYGISSKISLIAIFPVAGLVLLWIIAFKEETPRISDEDWH